MELRRGTKPGKSNFIRTIHMIFIIFIICAPDNSLVDGFKPYRVPGVSPKCMSVSAPSCIPFMSDSTQIGSKEKSRIRNNKQRGKRSLPPIDVPIKWRYNSTTFPNFANDVTPNDVVESLRHFHPLIATECSRFINLFLCSIYSPVCTKFGVVPPCRELCDKVKSDCELTIKTFGIEWPENIQCSFFPSYVPRNANDINNDGRLDSVGSMTSDDADYSIVIQRAASMTWIEALAGDGKICIPPTEDDVITPQLEALAKAEQNRIENKTDGTEVQTPHDYGLWCPAEMRSPPGQTGYTFLGIQNCSPPCPNMYLSSTELAGVRYVIIFMSSLCILVTFFTLCTFIIDIKRFRYPERPIVFYALSYFIVSLIFLGGFVFKEEVACNKEIRDENTNDIIQGFTVVKGDHKQTCTFMFMALYYFTVNGTIWWLILTITWLLAAGFKWGSEAIEKYSLYYHLVAWGIPALQTMAVVTFSKIEGDNIAGVCFLGMYDSNALRYLLLIPLCVYVVLGILILLTGFFCLNRVRKSLHNDNKKKLSKFMVRIGVFSVMFIVPQVILFAIYIAEDYYRSRWEATWFLKSCVDYRVPCPAPGSEVRILAEDGYQPSVALFCMKYIMTLIVALPPLFWVGSKKTLHSWAICCIGKRKTDNQVTTNLNNSNNNSNHIRSEHSSKKNLIQGNLPTKAKKSKHNKKRPECDGGDERDDVFGGLVGNNLLQGSSASVATAAASGTLNSRHHEILNHRGTTPIASEAGSLSRNKLKKEFPESTRRKTSRTNSTTSSRAITPSFLKQTSSISSTTSGQRKKQSKLNNNLPQTSSLNRREFRASRTRPIASPLATSVITRSVASTSEPNVSRSARETRKNNTVVILSQPNYENIVEV